MKFLAVIQARLASTRLPQKVLKMVGDKTILEHIIIRLQKINLSQFSFCFAIANEIDKSLGKFLQTKNINFIYGDEYNALSRFEKACENLDKEDYLFRLTADNPFVDYSLMQEAMQYVKINDGKIDYLTYSNLPLGMGFELLKVDALHRQHNYRLEANHLEHVTVAIRERPSDFQIVKLKNTKIAVNHYSDLAIRLTCDTEEDLAMLNKTANHFNTDYFTSSDVYSLYCKNSEFFQDNLHVVQRSEKTFQKINNEL